MKPQKQLKGKRAVIKLSYKADKLGDPDVMKEVNAFVIGDYACHRPAECDVYYRVSHIPSGQVVLAGIPRFADAKDLVGRCAALKVRWDGKGMPKSTFLDPLDKERKLTYSSTFNR